MKIIVFNDIHIYSEKDVLFSRKDILIKSLTSQLEFVDEALLLIVGDISQSGNQSQFKAFNRFLSEVTEKIKTKLRICIVPGNHDNCFDNSDDEIDREEKITELINNKLCKYKDLIRLKNVQKNYNSFYKDTTNFIRCEIKSNDVFCKSFLLEVDGEKIQINCFNTAWSSRKKGFGREIVFPTDYKVEKFKKSHLVDHCISMFHYPENWMEHESNKFFHEHVEKESDLIIVGHEHEEGIQYQNNFITKTNTIIYKSPPLQTKDKSLYSIVELNSRTNKNTITLFKFDRSRYTFYNEIDINDYRKSEIDLIKGNEYKLQTEHKKFLSDYGVDISHPQHVSINFDSLYVKPQFKIKREPIYIKTDLKRKLYVRDIDIKNNMIVYGRADFGKTSYLKYCFKRLYSEGLLPVYVDLSKVKKISNEEGLRKIIYSLYDKQYEVENKSIIQQESNDLKYILFDNVDKYNFNKSQLLKILNGFFKKYNNWIITSADLFLFDPYISDIESKAFDHIFNEYELIDFGYESREMLIRKWVSLNPNLDEENDCAREICELERMVNQLILSKLLEPLPLYLIIILQARDSSVNFNLDQSSKPHFYNYLILDAYRKLNLNTRSINLFERFLSDLAYKITSSSQEISYSDFCFYHSSYITKMKVSSKTPEVFHVENFLKGLIDVKILVKHSEIIRFKYNYHFCFYLSKYLVKDGNKGRKEMIAKLIDSIDKELSANILNYCIYHSNNNEIFDLMRNKANSIFESSKEFRMEEDIKEFNEKYKDLSPSDFDIKYVPDVKQTRIEIKRKQDEYDRANKESTLHEDEGKFKIELVNKLNQSVRTMEVIGGILKNGLMDLDGDEKVELGKESISIGLRTSRGFLEEISDDLIDIFEHYANESEYTMFSSEEVQQVRKSIYSMVKFSLYLFLTKTADVIANSNDDIVFEEVFKNTSVAKQIMHFMIKIFYLGDLDVSLIKEFVKKNKSNTLSIDCLMTLLSAYNNRYKIPLNQIKQINQILEENGLYKVKTLSEEYFDSLKNSGRILKE